ncbi:MLP protein 43 [Spatholobus suberectus]|nr:MLP protein 43 [Spatholobus suberectus]
MLLKGKVVIELGIRSPSVKFLNAYAKQLHDLHNIIGTVHDGPLHEGDWHDIVSVKSWTITIVRITRCKRSTLQVIDKDEGGAVTIWTMEIEKLNEDVAPPYRYLDILTAATKDIDAHVLKA